MRKLTILFLLLLISLCFSQQIIGRKPLLGEEINWSHPDTKGLVGLWILNEGSGSIIYDLSGNGNDGTLTSMVPLADWVTGRDGWALNFDGTDDFIALDGDNPGMETITNKMTVSLWAKQDALGADDTFIMQGDYAATRDWSWCMQTSGTGGNERIQVFITDALNDGGGNHMLTPLGSWTLGWHRVLFVFNGTGASDADRLRMWLDDVEQVLTLTGTISSSLINPADEPFTIGTFSGLGRFWNGNIANVQIWNRVLTEQEVESLYIHEYAMFESPPGRILAAVAAAVRRRLIIVY